jgi:hypothetical protein
MVVDDTDQNAVQRLERWCKSHYTGSKTIQRMTLTATTHITTTAPPPPTTTLGTQPQHYEGSGDSIVDVAVPISKPAIVHVVGNSEGRFFAVTSYGPTNNRLDLLVNTTDPYDGHRPAAFTDGGTVAHFEVKSSGPWSIDVADLTTARFGASPGRQEGDGDDVIIMTPRPSRAHITGNPDGRYFGVYGYATSRALLVNTTDANYDGTVLVPSTGNLVFEVRASGHWAIDFS